MPKRKRPMLERKRFMPKREVQARERGYENTTEVQLVVDVVRR